MSANARRGLLVAMSAAALLIAACATDPHPPISVLFDQPMAAGDVGHTLQRCGIRAAPHQADSPKIWRFAPPASQQQLACLEGQPHVVIVRLAE